MKQNKEKGADPFSRPENMLGRKNVTFKLSVSSYEELRFMKTGYRTATNP